MSGMAGIASLEIEWNGRMTVILVRAFRGKTRGPCLDLAQTLGASPIHAARVMTMMMMMADDTPR